MSPAPRIVHLLHRLGLGGMELLLIERLNRLPESAYRHAIVSLTDVDERMLGRLHRRDVDVIALHKRPGLAPGLHLSVFRCLRRLRPALLHAYNLAALEYVFAARLAGVPLCVHGLHGREAGDPHGTRLRYRLLLRLAAPRYDACYANSAAMLAWLRAVTHLSGQRTTVLPNGVALARFGAPPAFDPGGPIVLGMAARLQPVKDPLTALHAFAILRERLPHLRSRLYLSIAGDGPMRASLLEQARRLELEQVVALPGARRDIPEFLSGLRVFVLSSLAEGMPGAVLEAMAAGLPVVAANVGGVPELVDDGVTGRLVPVRDPQALAEAVEPYVLDAALAALHGAAGRARVARHFAMERMVEAYASLYDRLLNTSGSRSCAA